MLPCSYVIVIHDSTERAVMMILTKNILWYLHTKYTYVSYDDVLVHVSVIVLSLPAGSPLKVWYPGCCVKWGLKNGPHESVCLTVLSLCCTSRLMSDPSPSLHPEEMHVLLCGCLVGTWVRAPQAGTANEGAGAVTFIQSQHRTMGQYKIELYMLCIAFSSKMKYFDVGRDTLYHMVLTIKHYVSLTYRAHDWIWTCVISVGIINLYFPSWPPPLLPLPLISFLVYIGSSLLTSTPHWTFLRWFSVLRPG